MRRASAVRACTLVLLAVAAVSCSAVREAYRLDGYIPSGDGSVKQIAVRAWGPIAIPALGATLALMTARLVNQYTNYLVHSQDVLARGWSEACVEMQGVLVVRALGVASGPSETTLDLSLELFRCADGALLWRTAGAGSHNPADEDLQNLTTAYVNDVGDEARSYAAPAFVLIKDLIEALPNPPPLTDEEIDQRIMLEIELSGRGPGPGRLGQKRVGADSTKRLLAIFKTRAGA